MKHYLKNFLFIPCLLVVFLVFLHPTSLVAMDPKVAAEATEEIISGVKNSLVLGDRTGDARVSEGVGKNSGESSVSTAIEGEKDVEEGLKISNEECSDKILAERYGMDQSLESDALLAQENITRLTDQIEEAKHEYKEERNIYFYLWDHIATKLEQSRESWNKVNELIALGNVERASLWRKAAEESEASAERLRKVNQAYASSQKETAEQLEKEAWRDYYLSDVSTWLLKLEEAREKADSIHDKDRDLWKNLAEQYQAAADYKRRASEAAIEEKKDKRDNYSLIGDSMYAIANRKLKAFEAKKIEKETLAMEYEHTVGILQKALEYLKQSLVAYSAGKDMEGFGWYNVGKSLKPQADYRIKACEAEDV